MTRAAEIPEDSKAFRVAVLIALVAAGGAALQQGVGGADARAVVLVGYPFGFFVAYATRRSRPFILRVTVTAVAFVVLMTFAASLSSQPFGSVAALQIPLAEVFLWLMLVHSFDSPGRRSLLITLLASTVLIAVAGVLSLSMAIVPFLALWAVAAVAALVLAQRSVLSRLPPLTPTPPVVVPAPRSERPTAILITLVVVAVLGTGAFMLAPVAGTDRALTFPAELPSTDAVPVLGGLSNPTLGSADPSGAVRPGPRGSRASFGYFGFSTRLDTSVRGRPDNTLVMRVRASAPDFWRAQTFDTWNGRVWTTSDTRPDSLTGDPPIGIPPAFYDGPRFATVGRDELVQTYYVERPGPNSIFAAATPTKLFFEDRTVFQLPDGSLRAGVQLDEGSVYTVVSQRPLVTEAALRASGGNDVPAELLAHYGATPMTTERVRALAAAVTANAPTPYDKVRALERWMGEHTKYTLDIPPLPASRDAVDQFLFVDRRGFCEQIGTSLVVMLRSLGIPARLAVGYATGERNPFTGLYEVRAKDAHAWAEVYFPGVGWQGFDPTASVPLAGDSSIDGAGDGALAYLNARVEVPAWAPAAIGLAALAIGMVLLGRLLVRRGRRRRDRVEPSWAATRLAQLERLGAQRGRARAPGETTPEYAAALARLDPFAESQLLDIAGVLDALMFSPGATHAERQRIDDALSDLSERWRRMEPTRKPVLAGS